MVQVYKKLERCSTNWFQKIKLKYWDVPTFSFLLLQFPLHWSKQRYSFSIFFPFSNLLPSSDYKISAERTKERICWTGLECVFNYRSRLSSNPWLHMCFLGTRVSRPLHPRSPPPFSQIFLKEGRELNRSVRSHCELRWRPLGGRDGSVSFANEICPWEASYRKLTVQRSKMMQNAVIQRGNLCAGRKMCNAEKIQT